MFQFGNMKLVFVAASAFVAFSVTGNVWASGSSTTGTCTQSGSPLATTVANLKGNFSCADIQGRSVINGTLTTNADGSINWSVSANPGNLKVTEVLVQGTNGGNTCEYVYTGNASSGSGLGFLKSTGSYQTVQGVSLCTDGSTIPVPSTIPSCTDFSGIDGVTINCPASGARSIIYNFEVGQPFFNLSGTPMACVCNGAALQQCDPNVPAGQPNACTGATVKNPTEVTTHIEINNDPYVCQTIGGTRRCYSY